MATPSESSCQPKRCGDKEPVKSIPSPEQVRQMAAQIRQSWSPRQRRHRALLARHMLWRQLSAQ